MENNKHINSLLEKFWAGNSSLDEEQTLRKAIFDPQASEKLKGLRSLFLGPNENVKLSKAADEKFNQAFAQIQTQALLDKYYAGATSLEEEAELKKLVSSLTKAIGQDADSPNDFNAELSIAKMMFAEPQQTSISKKGEAKMLAFFDELQAENAENGKSAKVVTLANSSKTDAKIRSLPKRNWLKIAVVGLLLIGIGSIWTKRVNDMEKAEAQLAYQQTKDAFELLGMHFNKGEQTTINTIRNASENLDILN